MPPTSSLMTSDLSSSEETMSSTSLAGTSSKAQTPSTTFQRESTSKRAEAPQHGLVGSRQEVVAPVDCPSKRLMTREGNTISPGQKGKTVIQATEDLLDRQDPGPHRRQLDRQWQTVEPPAKADDRHPVRVAQLEIARRRRPLGEQHDGLVLLQLGDGVRAVFLR